MQPSQASVVEVVEVVEIIVVVLDGGAVVVVPGVVVVVVVVSSITFTSKLCNNAPSGWSLITPSCRPVSYIGVH